MTLYELTKKYGEGKGESTMWKTLATVSDAIEHWMPEENKLHLIRQVYGKMSGDHYNEEFAREDVARMFYRDKGGSEYHAPYWTDDQVKEVYNKVSGEIPEYNFWDFYVTLQMMKADNCPVIMKWLPNASPEERDRMLVDMSVSWLNDPDSRHRGNKVWNYLNG